MVLACSATYTIPDVFKEQSESWEAILQDDSIMLPAPLIKLYDQDGNLLTTKSQSPQSYFPVNAPFDSIPA